MAKFVNIFLVAIVSIGFVLVFLGAVPASIITYEFLAHPGSFGYHAGFGVDFPAVWAWYLSAFGTVLVLIGGLIARTRQVWLPLVFVGLLNLVSFTGYYVYLFRDDAVLYPVLRTLATAAPALLCIGVGLVIRYFARRQLA
jgi:hypothetical protein